MREPWPQWGRESPGKQIVGILQEYAAGAKVSDLCRKHGMSDTTLYKWKAKYGGMTVSKLRRLKNLEAENSELIPTRETQYPWAHSLIPIERIFQGCSVSLFQTWQQWSRMSS